MFIGALSPLAKSVVSRMFPIHNTIPRDIPQIGRNGNHLKERRLLIQRTSNGMECRITDQLPNLGGIISISNIDLIQRKIKVTP